MRTPRPHGRSTSRGINTLIGNGWLRESPKNLFPREWDLRGKSALRKCVMLPLPPELRELAPHQVSPSALPPAPPRREAEIVPSRRNPAKDVRMFPAFPGPSHAPPHRHARSDASSRRAWWEDPVALGGLLILAPPIGLAAVWSSRRYSSDARWALTVMTALTMCLTSAIVIAAIVMR